MKTAGEILKAKKSELISVSPDTTLANALKIMSVHNFGAILVKEGEKIIGIWTERDLVFDSIKTGFDCKNAIIKDYMSTNLKSAKSSDTIYHLMEKFLGLKLRHLLIEENGEYIGMLTSGDVLKEVLLEKNNEISDLTSLVGWEYYDNRKVE